MFLNTKKKTRNSQLVIRSSSRGFTLIEMLISMAVTLIMMAAVVSLFANIGEGVRNRNAGIELGGQIRLARARLYKDLAGATCPARPKLKSDFHNDGYLEIIEGQWSDKNPSLLIANSLLNQKTSIIPGSNTGPTDVTNGLGLGDYDDILALTVRSDSEPFQGRVSGTTIEANEAEVIWYAVENPANGSLGEPGMRTVYRRVLLIAPWVNVSIIPPVGSNTAEVLKNFYDSHDISVRLEAGRFVANTLSDLTKREHRFAHLSPLSGGSPPHVPVFPWRMDDNFIRFVSNAPTPLAPLAGGRIGEDVMLNDVLAFDLRVYDPGAPLRRFPQPPTSGADVPFVTLEPSDRGWDTAVGVKVGFGGYVDLGWGHAAGYGWTASEPPARFFLRRQAGWHPRFPTALIGYPCVYDTWPYSYENDGLDQDNGGGGLVDQGTDGLDNDNANGVDDSGERETSPPYDVALRAMQVKFRIYDRETRQIREATVMQSFVPQ